MVALSASRLVCSAMSWISPDHRADSLSGFRQPLHRCIGLERALRRPSDHVRRLHRTLPDLADRCGELLGRTRNRLHVVRRVGRPGRGGAGARRGLLGDRDQRSGGHLHLIGRLDRNRSARPAPMRRIRLSAVRFPTAAWSAFHCRIRWPPPAAGARSRRRGTL